MEYSKVLKQAWKNVTSYRALWIFGILLALTTASSSSAAFSQSGWRTDADSVGILGTGVTLDMQPGERFSEALRDAWSEAKSVIRSDIAEANRELTTFFRQDLGLGWRADILKFFTVVLWIALILILVGKVIRYLSETALIKMVDDQEETGEQRRGREGFRLGWSRTSWRLFLIDLVIDIPVALVFILLFGLVFAPLLLWGLGITEVGLLSVAFTSGLFFLFIFLAIIAGQAVHLLKQFARRTCALEGTGVIASISRGFTLLKNNLKQAGLIWLILVGVGIGYPLLVGVVTVLLLAFAAMIGGGLGLLAGMTANALGAAHPILIGFGVGIPIAFLLLTLPILFMNGLKEVFTSSTWTLTYRELRSKAGLTLETLPEPE
ncbi:MAG: hypothetical protein PVI78_12650 [Anaerolineales bacterium]